MSPQETPPPPQAGPLPALAKPLIRTNTSNTLCAHQKDMYSINALTYEPNEVHTSLMQKGHYGKQTIVTFHVSMDKLKSENVTCLDSYAKRVV